MPKVKECVMDRDTNLGSKTRSFFLLGHSPGRNFLLALRPAGVPVITGTN